MYHLTRFQSRRFHVFFVHEQHPPLVENAPIAVMQAVNGSIKLVMAADGHQQVFVGFQSDIGYVIDGEMRLLIGRFKKRMARPVGQIKAGRILHPLVERIKAGYYLFNQIPYVAVIVAQRLPVRRGRAAVQNGFCHFCYNGHFALQRGGRKAPALPGSGVPPP